MQIEPILQLANMILYWDRSILTDETVDFSRPDTVFIDSENKTALVIDTAVPLTHSFLSNEAEKITKYENLTLEIKNIWKLNNVSVYPLVISAEVVVTKSFLKYIENTGLTKNILRVGQTCHTVRKFLGHAP